jgi:hypothetical protein
MSSKRANLHRVLLASAGIALAAGLAGASSAQQPPKSECIGSSYSSSWVGYDDHTILARSNGRTFLVTTDACPRLAAPMTHITVVPLDSGRICEPHDARLYVTDNSDQIRIPCYIQSIRLLAADEAKAIESKKR